MQGASAKVVNQPPKTILVQLVFRQLGKRVKVEVAPKQNLIEMLPQLASTICLDMEYLKFIVRTKEGKACSGDVMLKPLQQITDELKTNTLCLEIQSAGA